ncbi:SapC family protein [Alteromonas sp. ASW11-36]|uniref:SapC family protein n=1 Tax=Alteromonas arenosi TaxID=3055817 RepID=A0ABT7SSD9_9ALTE|nr:SapC family protein [Alteromonas sp. ASW11-36]MDM7859102.1 SapC family protein [Alteromonas sp. ASW11-36]
MAHALHTLNENEHKDYKVSLDRQFNHAAEQHLIPIMTDEIFDAALEFPLVVVKNSETGAFTLCAIQGLKPETNLYCGREQYDAIYVPRALRLYPFALRENAQTQQLEICIIDDPARVGVESGEALFDAEGNKSQFLEQQIKLLKSHTEMAGQTMQLMNLLEHYELLHAQAINIKTGSEEISFDGIYVINQQKLNTLAPDVLVKLRDNGALALIYAIQQSLKQINRLIVRTHG